MIMPESVGLLSQGRSQIPPLKIDIRSSKISDNDLNPVIEILKSGGTVIFPTDTVYGIGTNAFDKKGVDRIYRLKKRPRSMPLIILISSTEQLKELTMNYDLPVVRKLGERFWPGALTVILEKSSKVPDEVSGGGKTVGVRMPDNNILRRLIELSGVPLASTSANISAGKSAASLKEVPADLIEGADVVLDGGSCELGKESTVIEVKNSKIKILREAAISRDEIFEVLGSENG
jgi:L-threonylcarbamoyladenylate synthase